MLRHIADTYNLEFLRPFASYGSWVKEYPNIPCGPKRGFSYFNHQVGGGELLVAANPDLEHADTHWYRESFDASPPDPREVRSPHRVPVSTFLRRDTTCPLVSGLETAYPVLGSSDRSLRLH